MKYFNSNEFDKEMQKVKNIMEVNNITMIKDYYEKYNLNQLCLHRLSFYKIYCEEVVLNLCISTSSLYMRINVCTATDGTY